MSELPEEAVEAFEAHDAYEAIDEGFAVTTTVFDARVVASEDAGDEWALRYEVTVRMPMLSTAVTDEAVGPAVEDGWFDTLELRLADAPMSVRDGVELDEFDLREASGEAVARYVFEWGDAGRAADVARAFVEYAEGTYVEGVVPGYEYGDPVASLLSQARQAGDAGSDDGTGPMPL